MRAQAKLSDEEELAISDPAEYARRLQSYSLLLGTGSEMPPNLTVASIPSDGYDDGRRFNVGLSGLTAQMGAFQAGEFVVVGAREGHGKTVVGELIALRNSVDYKVLFISLEMLREEIRDRMLCKLMGCGLDGLRSERNRGTDDFLFAQTELNQRQLYVYRPIKKSERTITALTKFAEKVTPDIMIIDYGREITGWNGGYTAAAEIVEYLEQWARSSWITTVLLAQLNRKSVEGRPRRPQNSDLQDTDRLGQKAHRVLLLYRPFLGTPSMDRVMEIAVSKNRKGNMFRWHAHWDGDSMNLHDMTDEESANAACCRRKKSTRQA